MPISPSHFHLNSILHFSDPLSFCFVSFLYSFHLHERLALLKFSRNKANSLFTIMNMTSISNTILMSPLPPHLLPHHHLPHRRRLPFLLLQLSFFPFISLTLQQNLQSLSIEFSKIVNLRPKQPGPTVHLPPLSIGPNLHLHGVSCLKLCYLLFSLCTCHKVLKMVLRKES